MTALLTYEWRRLRSLPGNRALLAAVVAFALVADLTAAGKPLDAEGVVFHVVQRDLAVRWLVAAAIGAQAFGHEFRYGTIRPALLGFPRRGRLLAGKTAAASLAGTAGALLASAASFAWLLVLTSWDRSLLGDPRLWRSLAYGAVTVGLVAAMAAGLGALTRGTGLPVVVLALWGGFLEPLVAAVLGGGAGPCRSCRCCSWPPTPATPSAWGRPARCRWWSSRSAWPPSWPRPPWSSPAGTRPPPDAGPGGTR